VSAAPAELLPPAAVIEAFDLDPASLEAIDSGHINRTWAARSRGGRAVVLQRVNDVFPASVNLNVAAVTSHLAAKGLTTPELVPTRSGQLWFEADAGVWRLLTRIEGWTSETVSDAAQAGEAGRALGRFHAALADFEPAAAATRAGVHDTARHLRQLERALAAHAVHADFAAVEPIAAALSAQAALLGPVPEEPARIVHGDPKISNILFNAAGAVCLIDLDTLGRAPMCLELGDALRSWCNTTAEDSPAATLDAARFEAAIAGYSQASAGLLTETEWQALPAATHRIAVELAARFLTDALEERYFGWDRRRFASAGAHNRARAEAQLALARSTAAQLDALGSIVDRHRPRSL